NLTLPLCAVTPRQGIMPRHPMRELHQCPQEVLGHLAPGRNFHKILPARQHPTNPQPHDIHQRVLESGAWAAGIGDRLQLLPQGTRHWRHNSSLRFPLSCPPCSILTPSFYKGPSAFPVATALCCHAPPAEGGLRRGGRNRARLSPAD